MKRGGGKCSARVAWWRRCGVSCSERMDGQRHAGSRLLRTPPDRPAAPRSRSKIRQPQVTTSRVVVPLPARFFTGVAPRQTRRSSSCVLAKHTPIGTRQSDQCDEGVSTIVSRLIFKQRNKTALTSEYATIPAMNTLRPSIGQLMARFQCKFCEAARPGRLIS